MFYYIRYTMRRYLQIGWMIMLFMMLFACHKSSEYSPSLLTRPFYDSLAINVKAFGAKADGINDDTPAFEKAMESANLLGKRVFVPMGRYKANIKILYDNIIIVGEAQPNKNLKEGTVIVGSINANNKKNIEIANLGIDARSVLNWVDAALDAGVYLDTTPLNHIYNHITLVGPGFHAKNHGILCQSGPSMIIKNILVADFFHGIAVKSSDIQLDSIKADNCGFTSIVIKSDEGGKQITQNINVNHVTINGDKKESSRKGGAIMVQSAYKNSLTSDVLIQNVYSNYGSVGALLIEQLQGVVNNVQVKNFKADNPVASNIRAAFDIYGGSNIVLNTCTSIQSLGYGFRTAGVISNIRVEKSFESGSRGSAYYGNFNFLELNGRVIFP